MGRAVVKELIQGDFNARNLLDEMRLLLNDADYQAHIKAGYAELREKLGQNQAAKKTAELMVQYLQAS